MLIDTLAHTMHIVNIYLTLLIIFIPPASPDSMVRMLTKSIIVEHIFYLIIYIHLHRFVVFRYHFGLAVVTLLVIYLKKYNIASDHICYCMIVMSYPLEYLDNKNTFYEIKLNFANI